MVERPVEGIVVRRIRAEEWEAHRALRLKSLANDRIAFGSSSERESQYSEAEWRERTEKGASSTSSSLSVAEAPGRGLVGMAVGALVEGRLWVFGMWVEPSWRGRGTGGALLDSAIAWLHQQRPGEPIFLDVNPRQTAAVRLYESRGFRVTGKSKKLDHSPGEIALEMSTPPKTKDSAT
jgi:ribosomal protein S18 acetylase RimI-like enzyme